MRAYLWCRLIMRLDGADPVNPPPESEGDYRPEWKSFWTEMGRWMHREGIEPCEWVPAGWNGVDASASFDLADAVRVTAWLKEQAVTVGSFKDIEESERA
jgi:hypothetical protein